NQNLCLVSLMHGMDKRSWVNTSQQALEARSRLLQPKTSVTPWLMYLAHPEIEEVAITAEDSPSGTAPITEDGIEVAGPPGTPEPEPTVVNDHVLMQGTLTAAADSQVAVETVRDIRSDLDDAAPSAMVGGVTATD